MTQDILSKPINLEENDELVLEPKKEPTLWTRNNAKNGKNYIKYNILQEIETLTSKEEAQKKKDSVVNNKLPDTIKYAPTTAEQKRVKATSEVKDLITDSFRRFKRERKWTGLRFI